MAKHVMSKATYQRLEAEIAHLERTVLPEVADRVVILADGEIVADGATSHVVTSSPMFAPQVAKILAPQSWLTVQQVAIALEESEAAG